MRASVAAPVGTVKTLDKPITRVGYEFRERGSVLAGLLERFERKHLAP